MYGLQTPAGYCITKCRCHAALSSRTHRFMPGLRAAWAFEVIQIAALWFAFVTHSDASCDSKPM